MKKVVLITGAAGGIGNATAKKFASAGWQTIGVDKVKAVSDIGLDRFVQIDLSNSSHIQSVFSKIYEHEGRLDVLVNCAALQLLKPLVATEPEEWEQVMSVNLRAAYLTIKYGYPLLRVQGGSIINISSVHAVATSHSLAAYAASKGALTALTRAASLELAKDKIRVNAILPGAIDTEMLRSGLSRDHLVSSSIEERIIELGNKHCVKRIGRPEEISELILFLADSSKSGFLTGQSLIVDGGATIHLSTE